jgi:hypothetical protein
MSKYFSSSDLARIKRNTNYNNHGGNYEFIAKKINSRLEKQFRAINRKHEKIGYLPGDLAKKRYNLSRKLMVELRRKSPEEFQKVDSRL